MVESTPSEHSFCRDLVSKLAGKSGALYQSGSQYQCYHGLLECVAPDVLQPGPGGRARGPVSRGRPAQDVAKGQLPVGFPRSWSHGTNYFTALFNVANHSKKNILNFAAPEFDSETCCDCYHA